MGTPLQKINAHLNQDSSCFLFKKSELDNINNNKFIPNKSETFNKNKIKNTLPDKEICFDFFYFFENKEKNLLTFLLENKNENKDKNEDENNNKDNIIKENYTYIPEIGISPPIMYLGNNIYSCPNFIYDIKTLQLINKRIFSIKYYNNLEGEFIIGDNLHNYPKAKLNENQYYSKYFYLEYIFSYNSIFTKNSWNKITYVNFTDKTITKKAMININSGFIIGTEDFQNYIHKTFFKYLIEKNICRLNLVKYDNITTEKLGNEFYIYDCHFEALKGTYNQGHDGINYYREFPNLIIRSTSFGYDFELSNNDLFEQNYDRIYFLIIFRKNIPQNEKNTWYLGEPFFKKYPFTIDYDAKSIGFYLDKKDNEDKNNNNKNESINSIGDDIDNNRGNNIANHNNSSNDNKSKLKKILITIGKIIMGIILLIGAYYIGMKVKEGRKKRANELKDDVYEYIPDNKKDININSDNNNISKKNQTLELSDKLGLKE